MNDLNDKIKELKDDKNAIKDYLKCFYEVEKIREAFSEKEEFKKIEEYLRKGEWYAIY